MFLIGKLDTQLIGPELNIIINVILRSLCKIIRDKYPIED